MADQTQPSKLLFPQRPATPQPQEPAKPVIKPGEVDRNIYNCPTCKGLGIDPTLGVKATRCTTCGGTGKV